MDTLFYLSAIFLLWNELGWIVSPIKKTQEVKRFFELSTLNKGKSWKEYSEEYKQEVKSRAWLLIPVIWLFVGLLSSQWALFLGVILLNFIILPPISNLTRYSLAYTFVHWINSLIGFAFGLFVVINHFHLKIDTYQFVLNFIN
jgi:hypothetical protein